MSASLDIGQAKDDLQATRKVWQLCANLDAHRISVVNTPEGKTELAKYLNIPVERKKILKIKLVLQDEF